jgi:hypothetical protein
MNSIPNLMPQNGTSQYLLHSVTQTYETDSGYCELNTTESKHLEPVTVEYERQD